eukprot:2169728-Pleurochrysis_carterae.AAC.2
MMIYKVRVKDNTAGNGSADSANTRKLLETAIPPQINGMRAQDADLVRMAATQTYAGVVDPRGQPICAITDLGQLAGSRARACQ